MAERLNNLAQSQLSVPQHSYSDFYPRAASLSVSSADDLAAVNEFLVTLGREVSVGGHRPHSTHQSYAQDNFFDTESLSALGLSGMPGISVSHYPNDLAYSSPTQQPIPYATYSSPLARSSTQPGQYNSIYPSIYPTINPPPSASYPSHEFMSPKYTHPPAGIPYPSPHPQHLSSSTPEGGSPHSHSPRVTPSATPPGRALAIPDPALTATFDYIRPSRGAAPVPQLAPVDYLGKSLRTIVSLKAVPRIDLSEARNSYKLSALLNPEDGAPSEKKQPALPPPPRLPPLATPLRGEDGDSQCRLPPLYQMYRSPTPSPTRDSKQSSPTSSPNVNTRILPGLRLLSITPQSRESERGRGHSSRDDHERQYHRDDDEQHMDVDNVEQDRPRDITAAERRKHALVIRSLLISINNDFKRRFGTPATRSESTFRVDNLPVGATLRIATSEVRMSRDVEMSVA
jgi:hypothetical protein